MQFSIHFRHGSVINSTNISAPALTARSRNCRNALSRLPPLLATASCVYRLSELTVLTLSARTSACECICAYISARGKCNHWKSVDSQRGVCVLNRNPQFMQSTLCQLIYSCHCKATRCKITKQFYRNLSLFNIANSKLTNMPCLQEPSW